MSDDFSRVPAGRKLRREIANLDSSCDLSPALRALARGGGQPLTSDIFADGSSGDGLMVDPAARTKTSWPCHHLTIQSATQLRVLSVRATSRITKL